MIDISAPGFQPPEGYTLEQLLTRIHYDDGLTIHIGLAATLAYWRQAGLKKAAALLMLAGVISLWGFYLQPLGGLAATPLQPV